VLAWSVPIRKSSESAAGLGEQAANNEKQENVTPAATELPHRFEYPTERFFIELPRP
jgi:hypothetical protein